MQRLVDQDAADEAADPLPLSGYLDYTAHRPDLSKFDPGTRCLAAANGEATVFVSGVAADAPHLFAAASPALLQAAEAGLTPAALARHLVNAAMGAAGVSAAGEGSTSAPRLPVPPPPVLPAQSFALSHLTGANRPLGDVQAELDEFHVRRRGGGRGIDDDDGVMMRG